MVASAAWCHCSAATLPRSVNSCSLGNLADSFPLYKDGRRSRRSTIRRAPNTTALLPQPLASVLDLVAIAAATGGLALSALPLLTGQASRDNADRPFNSDTEEEDFSLGVAAGVSFIPYANWTVRIRRHDLMCLHDHDLILNHDEGNWTRKGVL